MRYNGIIFDFDGTLVDSLGDIVDSMNHVLAEKGFPPHTREEYRSLVGKGIEDLAEKSLPPDMRDRETVKSILVPYKKRYHEHCLIKTGPYPGIVYMLEKIKKHGIYIAVLSNKAEEFTRYMADRLFAGDLFDDVVGAREGVPAKPHPESSIGIAARAGIQPGQFLFVGDSGSDMKTARNACMTPLGVLWGYRDRPELEKEGAMYIVNHPREILSLLGI